MGTSQWLAGPIEVENCFSRFNLELTTPTASRKTRQLPIARPTRSQHAFNTVLGSHCHDEYHSACPTAVGLPEGKPARGGKADEGEQSLLDPTDGDGHAERPELRGTFNHRSRYLYVLSLCAERCHEGLQDSKQSGWSTAKPRKQGRHLPSTSRQLHPPRLLLPSPSSPACSHHRNSSAPLPIRCRHYTPSKSNEWIRPARERSSSQRSEALPRSAMS